MLSKNNQRDFLNVILEWGKTHLLLPTNEQLLGSLEGKFKFFLAGQDENSLEVSLEEVQKQVDSAKTTLSDTELITATKEDNIWVKALESFTVFDKVVYFIEAAYYLIAANNKEMSERFLTSLDKIMLDIITWLDEGSFSPLRLTVLNDARRSFLKQIPEKDQYQFPWYEIYANYNENIMDIIAENFDTFISNDVELVPETLKSHLPEILQELKRDRVLFSILKQLFILHKCLLEEIPRYSAVTLFQLGESSASNYLLTPCLEEVGLIRTSINIIKNATSVVKKESDKVYGMFLAAFCGPGLQDEQRLHLLNKVEDMISKIDTTELTGNTANVLNTLKLWFGGKCENSRLVSVSFDTWMRLLEKNSEGMKPMEHDEDPKELWNAINTLLDKPIQPEPSKDSLFKKNIESILAWIDRMNGICAPPLSFAWLGEETEIATEQIPLDIKGKFISLSMKPDTSGSYAILPYPDAILLCSNAGDYKNLWKFVGNTENYGGGCMLTDDYTPKIFPAQQIKKRIFHEVESDKYKKAIIGISSKKEDIEEFVCRLQEYLTLPEKRFEKLLNIVVLIISFETGNQNA